MGWGASKRCPGNIERLLHTAVEELTNRSVVGQHQTIHLVFVSKRGLGWMSLESTGTKF